MGAACRRPLRKKCSIRDLAAHLGLSTCTVSRVLNNSGGSFSPETRERVLAAARELDYVPNVNAKRLFTRKSGVIGLLVPSHTLACGNVFGDGHFVNILSGMEPVLEEHGYHLMLLFRNEERNPGERYLPLFRAGSIDGLLIWGAPAGFDCHRELDEHGFPYLFLTAAPQDDAALPLVASDYRRSAREITERLGRRGCRKLLFLNGPEQLPVSAAMRTGVLEAAAGRMAVEIRHLNYGPEETLATVKKEKSHDAVLLASDLMVSAELCRLSSRNGRPLGIVDRLIDGPAVPPRSITAVFDDRLVGQTAMKLLIDRMNHGAPGTGCLLAATITEDCGSR